MQKLIDGSSGTITLTQSYTLNSSVTVKVDEDITIDFAGNTVTFNDDSILIVNGTLTVKNTVNNVANDTTTVITDTVTGSSSIDTCLISVDGGNLIVESGAITVSSGKVETTATTGVKSGEAIYCDAGSVVVSGTREGTLVSSSGGRAILAKNETTVSVSGGTITGAFGVAIESYATTPESVKISGSPAFTGTINVRAAILNKGDGYAGTGKVKVVYVDSEYKDAGTAVINNCEDTDVELWEIDCKRYELAYNDRKLVLRQKVPLYVRVNMSDYPDGEPCYTLAEAVGYINEYGYAPDAFFIFVKGAIEVPDGITISSCYNVVIERADAAIPAVLELGENAYIKDNAGELRVNNIKITYAGTESAVIASAVGSAVVDNATITASNGIAIENTGYCITVKGNSSITGKTDLGDIKTDSCVLNDGYTGSGVVRIIRTDEFEAGDYIVKSGDVKRWKLMNEGWTLTYEPRDNANGFYAYREYAIYPVAITIDSPTVGYAPAASATAGDEDIVVGAPSWTPSGTTEFAAGGTYAVEIPLSPPEGYAFTSDFSATVNDEDATVISSGGLSATVKYDFGTLTADGDYLQGLIDGKAAGDTLTLAKKRITLDKVITVARDLTIDLKGCAVNCGKDYYIAVTGGTVKNTDAGAAIYNGTGGTVQCSYVQAIEGFSKDSTIAIYGGKVLNLYDDNVVAIRDVSKDANGKSKLVLSGTPEIGGEVWVESAIDGSKYAGEEIIVEYGTDSLELAGIRIVCAPRDSDKWKSNRAEYALYPKGDNGDLYARYFKPFIIKNEVSNSRNFYDTLKGAFDYIKSIEDTTDGVFTVYVSPMDDLSETVLQTAAFDKVHDVTLKSLPLSDDPIFTLEMGDCAIDLQNYAVLKLENINVTSANASRKTPLVNVAVNATFTVGADLALEEALFTRAGGKYTADAGLVLYPTWRIDGVGSLPGDVNDDGRISTEDAQMLVKIIAGLLIV